MVLTTSEDVGVTKELGRIHVGLTAGLIENTCTVILVFNGDFLTEVRIRPCKHMQRLTCMR